MALGLLDDELVGAPIIVAPHSPRTVASGEVLWGPNPVPPPLPPALLQPVAPEAGDPPPAPVPDLPPFVNDLTVTVNGTPWIYSKDRRVQVPINDTGTGSAVGVLSDPVGAGIVEDDEIQFTLKGVNVLLGRATKITRNEVTPEEEAGQTISVHADGVLSEWSDMVVYPDLGAGAPERMAPPRQDTRIFNYSASTGVDDSSWLPSVVTDPLYGDGPLQRFTRPESWPDPNAHWIWDRDSSTEVPVGTMRFRDVFPMPAGLTGPLQCQLWVAADGLGECSLDGVKLCDIPGPYTGQSQHVDIVLGNHFHLFAAELTNFVGRSGLLWSILPIDGDRLGPSIVHSDPSTKAKGYMQVAPFTAGKIIRILYAENRVRGGLLLGWTCAFDDDVDSNGNPWELIDDYSIRVGLDGLSVLKQLAEQHIDFVCSPSQRILYAYRVGELGALSPAPLVDPLTMRGVTVEQG